jgi:L-amino acid N-acyltransferase YncA
MSETAAIRADDEPVLIRPSRESDVETMLAIYRHHVRSGVARDVEGTGAPEPDDLRDRRKNLKQTRLPHLVATYRGDVVGYAYAVLFRKRPAYRYTAKHSIYVHHAHLSRGIGRLLLQELMDACAAAGFRQMAISMPTTHPRWRCTRSSASRAPGCCAASPIATAAGPTPSWCNARSAPARPRCHRQRLLADKPPDLLRRKLGRLHLDAVSMQ